MKYLDWFLLVVRYINSIGYPVGLVFILVAEEFGWEPSNFTTGIVCFVSGLFVIASLLFLIAKFFV